MPRYPRGCAPWRPRRSPGVGAKSGARPPDPGSAGASGRASTTPPPEQARLAVDLGVVMASTGVARLFEEYLALTPDESAERVAWFFELLAGWAESHLPSHPPEPS